jgi:hypothetical protein
MKSNGLRWGERGGQETIYSLPILFFGNQAFSNSHTLLSKFGGELIIARLSYVETHTFCNI